MRDVHCAGFCELLSLPITLFVVCLVGSSFGGWLPCVVRIEFDRMGFGLTLVAFVSAIDGPRPSAVLPSSLGPGFDLGIVGICMMPSSGMRG